MGWPGGCLAAGLVRNAVFYYCLGGCSALVVCARRSRQVWGVGTGASSLFSLASLPSKASLAVRVAAVPSGCPFPSPAGTPFHVVCAFYGLGLVGLRLRVACPLGVGVLALPRCTRLPPPPVGVARAVRAVLGQGAGRAVPYGSCLFAFPAPVPCSS